VITDHSYRTRPQLNISRTGHQITGRETSSTRSIAA
jgi:hypothetical protein